MILLNKSLLSLCMLPEITDEKLQSKFSEIIAQIFPELTILSIEKINSGLQSKIFKVHLSGSPFVVIARQSGLKNFEKSIQILSYLKENTLPVPKVFYDEVWEDTGLSLLEFIPGDTALEYFRNADTEERKTVLNSIGHLLSQLHNLPLQPFWFRKTYPIRTSDDWDIWIKERVHHVETYTTKTFSDDTQGYIFSHLSDFKKHVDETSHVPIVSLHGDVHLENIHVNETGEITGMLDFDTALRGKSYGDTGRFLYSLLLHDTHYEYSPQEFDDFLKGYNVEKTEKNMALIHGYFLLMLLEKYEIFAKEQNKKRFASHERVLEALVQGELRL